MKKEFIIISLTFLIIIAVIVSVQQNNYNTQEPFTAKINQMWRPHYRNVTTYTTETINTGTGNIKRFLRQNGLL
jgi:hypothetical protein